jgi:hypothetical protein
MLSPLVLLEFLPSHKHWIHQAMLDDWGILYPHEFQLRAIHNTPFKRD